MYTKVALTEITSCMRNGVEGTRWVGDVKIIAASQIYAGKVNESSLTPDEKRNWTYILERLGTGKYREIGYVFTHESLKNVADTMEQYAANGKLPSRITLPFLRRNWPMGGKTSEEQGFGENSTEHEYAHADTSSWKGRFFGAAKGVPLPSIGTRSTKGTIVDAGCSAGHSTADIAHKYPNCNIVGIDADKQKILTAQENYPELTFKVGNYLNLTSLLAANSTDMIVFGNNISHHLGRPAEIAVSYAHTILKEGGIIIIYYEEEYMLISHKQGSGFVNSVVWYNPVKALEEWRLLPRILSPIKPRKKE